TTILIRFTLQTLQFRSRRSRIYCFVTVIGRANYPTRRRTERESLWPVTGHCKEMKRAALSDGFKSMRTSRRRDGPRKRGATAKRACGYSRSEERRVGKEWRCRGAAGREK